MPRFLLFLLAFLSYAPEVFAFSFGGMEVKSKFGERFKAEIELDVESDDFSVGMGEEEDYKRLNLQRPSVVDELKIETPVGTRGSAKIISVISERPLFFPSFNLLVKATHDGGTILESFLVTVDFQRSLALNVKGAKKKKMVPPARQVDLLKGGEASPESPAGISPKPPEEKAVSAEAGRTVSPIPLEEAKAPAVEPKSPVPMVGYQTPRLSALGSKGVSPKIIPSHEEVEEVASIPPKLPQVEAKPSVSPEASMAAREQSAVQGSHTGPLQRGESLVSITEKLNVAQEMRTQAIVALWLDNQEKFIYGNMNGLRVGTDLSLVNLESRLANLELKTAQEILRSQWEEWEVVQKSLRAPEAQEDMGDGQEELLPSEEDNMGQVFEVLGDWKKTWEEGNFDKHISYFRVGAGGSKSDSFLRTESFKRRMFTLHKDVKIAVHNPLLIRMMDRPTATFEQGFSSSRIESLGRKDIRLVWEGLEWKIIEERFKVKEFREKRGRSPYADLKDEGPDFTPKGDSRAPFVIHSSSHLDYSAAVRVVNELRKQGVDAYSCPLYLSAMRKIYRVYVGRLPDWELAEALTRQIRSLGVGRVAVPYRAPYAIEVGSYRSGKEAAEQINSLRAQHLSPFLLVRGGENFSQPEFKVLIGAFSQAQRANRIIEDLQKLGVSGKLIEP